MIKISIVVPVYNVEKYLEKCLTSLVNQTLQEIEIIIVNDGTKDKSQDIIDQFVQRYPRKCVSLCKENGGLSSARNYGMKFCRGEYIGFVDSDDYVDLNMYEFMYDHAKEIDADMVVCDYLKEYPTGVQKVSARKYTSQKDMFMGGLAAVWNKIYRRTLIEQSNVVFPEGLIYEDTEFFCKLIPITKICGYVGVPFVHYMQREGSIANSQGKKVAMIFDIFDNIYQYYRENHYYNQFKDELVYFTIRVLLGSSMERICRCGDRNVRKQLLLDTIHYLDLKLDSWRKNPYLSDNSDKRNIYMRNVRKWNISLICVLLRVYFLRVNKGLY